MPVTMIQHVDDIILTSAALCNLKSKLIKTKEEIRRSNWQLSL